MLTAGPDARGQSAIGCAACTDTKTSVVEKVFVMKSLSKSLLALVVVGGAATLVACGGGGGSSDSTTPMGTLKVALTDAPACGFDHVNVTIQKVRVHQSATAVDTDAGWSEIVLNPAQRVDLLTLTNGVLSDLGQTPLPAGHYSQMRLVLAANDSTNALANSVVPTGGPEVALTTPSAQQTGLKLNVNIDIAANQLADFVLDFNACKSVVHAGASGKYLLKPVIAVTPNYVSGVSGYVNAASAPAGTTISVQQAGVVVKATTPDSTGKFVLEPVAPGTYDFVVVAPGMAPSVITGVPVASSTVTVLNSATTPLAFTLAADGTAAGTVTSATTPIDAAVEASQTLANGDVIDMGDTSADASTGAYSLTLAASAPLVSAYVATPGSFAFAADATAGATYTLHATSAGVAKTAGPLTVTSGATATTNFSF